MSLQPSAWFHDLTETSDSASLIEVTYPTFVGGIFAYTNHWKIDGIRRGRPLHEESGPSRSLFQLQLLAGHQRVDDTPLLFRSGQEIVRKSVEAPFVYTSNV